MEASIMLTTTLHVLTFVLFSKAVDQEAQARPGDCDDIQRLGVGTGIYVIYPDGRTAVRVRCDMDTSSRGWTVIQKRISNATDFYRTWKEYRGGFGDLETNFWLGNDNIHMISSRGSYELRIDMSNNQNETRYAWYDALRVADVFNKFKLSVGFYHGNAGDSLSGHNGYVFTTKDVDNDSWSANCAATYIGAWWYTKCHSSNLNGDYGNTAYAKGISWKSWEGYYKSLKTVEMKIRQFRPEVAESIFQP